MVNSVIKQGQSVAYFGLEDTDITNTTALMACHFGLPERFFEANYAKSADTEMNKRLGEALDWASELGPRWRVYDRKHGIADWRRFASMVMADKMRYNTSLVVVDHIQCWSQDFEKLSEISNMLVNIAQQANVTILCLSQVSNESLRHGTPEGMLAAKGTGALGALAHVGIEMYRAAGECDFQATPPVMQMLKQSGYDKFLALGNWVSEIGINMKVVRNGQPNKFFVLFEPWSGKILAEYTNPFKVSW